MNIEVQKGGAPAPGETITLTIGTAGHIDHGKTALVKLLTGCDCDTMPEEKARGMTIDLGFATCRLPDNRRVGLVDVPGHERFVHNMVAGASGIDVVMLVVAADDGIMPQTLEHFHIVRLLGVSSGLVALTKIDLVAPERVAEVALQIRELTAGSFLANCPVVPVSSKTGEGFDAFYGALLATINHSRRREIGGAFRMYVESSFVKQGIGTIVSGIPRCGTVRVGENLELLPQAAVKTVRGIQVYGADAAEAKAGECAAIRLGNLSREEAGRGTVLATPGYLSTTRIVNARLHLLPGLPRPLKTRSGIRFHVGTADVTGHMIMPGLTAPAPGSETCVQFQLDRPVVAAPGDFFVVRSLNPARTIGGGNVISQDNAKMRRSRGNWTGKVEEREKAFRDPLSTLQYILDNGKDTPQAIADLAKAALLSLDSAREHILAMAGRGLAVALPGENYASARVFRAVLEDIMARLNRLHDASPLKIAFSRKELFRDLKTDRALVEKAIEQLLAEGKIASTTAGLHIPQRVPRLSPRQEGLARAIREIYLKTGFASPRRDELPQLLGAPAAELDPVFDHLAQAGDIAVLSDKVVLHSEHLETSGRKLKEYISSRGMIESGAFKDVLGTTRKYSIPVLEYWDARGLTRRVGNVRYLKENRGA